MPKVRGCKFTMQRNDRIRLSNGESIEAICEKNAGCNFQPESKTHGNVAINADDALPDPEIKDKQAADDSTMDITAQIERIKNTIQKAANETTIYDPSYNDTQRRSQPSDIIADASEVTYEFTETTTSEQRAQSTGIAVTPETNAEPSSNNNNRKALLNYFRKYNGSSTNAATCGRAINTDTFKTFLSGAALEQNFFSSRMLTDVTNTSEVRTKRNSHHDPLLSSINDNSNPFARFSPQPYNSKLRSWCNQKQHSSQTDKHSNLFTSTAVNRNERRGENSLKEGNEKTPSENPSHKTVRPIVHHFCTTTEPTILTENSLQIPAKRALQHYTTGDRPIKANKQLSAFTRYMMEKRKTMKAMENFETNEKNTFPSEDTTFLHKPEISPSNRKINVCETRNKNITKSDGEGSSNMNEMNITEDASFLEKDLRTIRTCPVCNVPMLGVVSHYRRIHGVWDSKDRRRYLLRERIRIIRGKISRNYLKSKLTSYGVASDSTINAISEILDECGISVEEGGSKRIDELKLKNEESKVNLKNGPVTSGVSRKVKHKLQSNGRQTRRTSCESWRNLSKKCEEGNKDINKQVDDIAKQSICNDFSLQSMWISVDDIADKLP
uniref:Uncharacterized protein n=1 Tax=Ascaris lumbricoides TaxID=6252 RepID=A0A9J2Q1M3_ASCLU